MSILQKRQQYLYRDLNPSCKWCANCFIKKAPFTKIRYCKITSKTLEDVYDRDNFKYRRDKIRAHFCDFYIPAIDNDLSDS